MLSSVAATLLLSSFAQAAVTAQKNSQDIESIVVLPIKLTADIDQNKGHMFNEVATSELAAVAPKSVRILNAADLQAMIGHEATRQALGCEDSACLVEIGEAMGVSHLMQISLGRLGEKYALNTKLINVDRAKVYFRRVEYIAANDDAVLQELRHTIQALALKAKWPKRKRAAGSVIVPAKDSGADIVMWAELVGGVLGLAGGGGLGYLAYSRLSENIAGKPQVDVQTDYAIGLVSAAAAIVSGLAGAAGVTFGILRLLDKTDSVESAESESMS